MRRLLLLSTFASAAWLVTAASADEIILKDGRVLVAAKPYVVKGKQALLTLRDGTLVSMALSEIDVEKTAAARNAPPGPTPTPTPSRPTTPAEASRVKSGRKATLVLTEEGVGQSVAVEEKGEKKDEEGEERIEIASANAIKDKDGAYAVSGSVLNAGKVRVSGISVTIEAVGENNSTLASAFGTLAKDALDPGEKSTFQAKLTSDKEAKTFRYVPRWVIKVPVKQTSESVAASGPGGTGSTAEPAATPTAAPAGAGEGQKPAEPAAAPTPIPRPDMPARAPNAPVGAPIQPGGAFLPKPTGDQPKPLDQPKPQGEQPKPQGGL